MIKPRFPLLPLSLSVSLVISGCNLNDITVPQLPGVGDGTEPVSNTAPILSGAEQVSVPEGETTVALYSATDAEEDALTFSISGDDAALFVIDANTGSLSLQQAADFESPQDADGDNRYQLGVEVSDGQLSDRLDVTVEITNVNEPVVYTATAIDGYLENAQVWLDLDGDLQPGANEPGAFTDSSGQASLIVDEQLGDPQQYALVAIAQLGQTHDADLGQQGGPVTRNFLLTSPPGQQVLTPLSTLTQLIAESYRQAGDSRSLDELQDEAQKSVTTLFSITRDQIHADFKANGDVAMETLARDLINTHMIPADQTDFQQKADNLVALGTQLQAFALAHQQQQQAQTPLALALNPNGDLVASEDSDGDLVPDYVDHFPTDGNRWLAAEGEQADVDSDKDGLADSVDRDDDNDGVEDNLDPEPLNPDVSETPADDDTPVDDDPTDTDPVDNYPTDGIPDDGGEDPVTQPPTDGSPDQPADDSPDQPADDSPEEPVDDSPEEPVDDGTDSDNDGLTDMQEDAAGLDKHSNSDGALFDSDNDNLLNIEEVRAGLNPLDNSDGSHEDSDNDGILNYLEVKFGLDPLRDDADEDTDNDGYTNAEEVAYRLDPFVASGADVDTDGDGISNGDEISAGTNLRDDMLQLPDHLTLTIPDHQGMVEVELQRYSVRATKYRAYNMDGSKQIQTDNQRPEAILVTPESRTYRGHVVGDPNSTVVGSMMTDGKFRYLLFYGPDKFIHGADVAAKANIGGTDAYFAEYDFSGSADTLPSDAIYQKAMIQPREKALDNGDPNTQPDSPQLPMSSENDFYLYEFPVWGHMEETGFNLPETGQQSVAESIAFMEYNTNLANYMLTRGWMHHYTLTESVVESQRAEGDTVEGTARHKGWAGLFMNTRDAINPTPSAMHWGPLSGSIGRGTQAWAKSVPKYGREGTVAHEHGHGRGLKHANSSEAAGGANPMSASSRKGASVTSEAQLRALIRVSSGEKYNLYNKSRISSPAIWPYHPSARIDHAATYMNESVTFDALENDYDVNNDSFYIVEAKLNNPDTGELTNNGDGTLTYTPSEGYIGFANGYYLIEDSTGRTARAELHINVELNGLSHHYSMENLDGNLLSDSISSIAAQPVLSGAAAEVLQPGFYQQALAASAVQTTPADRSHTPHLWEPTTKSFSFSMWFKHDGSTERQHLAGRGVFGIGQTHNDGWAVYVEGNNLQFAMSDKHFRTRSPDLSMKLHDLDINDGEWHHLALVIDWENRTFSGYLDDHKVSAEIPEVMSIVSSSGTKSSYSGGPKSSVGMDGAEGAVDEVTVFHRALNDDEIAELRQNLVPAHSPLPKPGSLRDQQLISELSWQRNLAPTPILQTYRVYFSDDAEQVAAADPQVLITETTATSVAAPNFSSNGPHYWRVDIELGDGSVIPGTVWSIR